MAASPLQYSSTNPIPIPLPLKIHRLTLDSSSNSSYGRCSYVAQQTAKYYQELIEKHEEDKDTLEVKIEMMQERIDSYECAIRDLTELIKINAQHFLKEKEHLLQQVDVLTTATKKE